MSSTQAFAVDWLQNTPAVFDQLRANHEWTCGPTVNSIGGMDNALACTISGVNSRKVEYKFVLTATPSPWRKWIAEFTIAVVPVHSVPDAEINEHYIRVADFPYRGARLKDRFGTIDEMLTTCRRQGEKRPLQCAFSETGRDFETLIVTASTDGSQNATFFLVTISAGRNARCLEEPECVTYYGK
jgi:hypothetical protein